MKLIERIQLIASERHGKAIIFGFIAIIVTFLTIGISVLASNISSGKNNSINKLVKTSSDGVDRIDFKEDDKLNFGEVDKPIKESSEDDECDSKFPEHSYKKIYKEGWAGIRSNKAEFQIENTTNKPIWVKLLHPNENYPIIGMMVYPMQKMQQKVNIGIYDVEFSIGKNWCNASVGITEGRTMGLADSVRMGTNSISILKISEDNDGNLDAGISKG